MKPILININEISDSRERYESKPNFYLVIFNYAVLGIMVVSLIWMYFGKIDIVVKSEGLIRPNSQVATVVNTYGGTLEEVYIKDGSIVKKGDTLYVIEHEDLLTELDYYNEQLADTDNTLVMLNKYKKSIEDEFNYFTEVPDEEEYFVKVKSYLMNCKLSENEVDYNVKERDMSLDTVTDQLVKLSGEFNNTKKLKSAIISNKNLYTTSSEELEYYHKYLKYQSDYEILNQKYLSTKAEINKSTAEEGLVNSQKYYNNALMGLKILKSSIENGKNQFDAESSYSLQYEEYINKIADLTTTYEQAKETYEVNKALEGLAVSEWDVQQSKNALEEAERAVDTYKISFMNNITSNITEMEKNIEEITLNKKNTMSKEKLLKQNENDRISALDNFKLQYIVELDNAINTLKDNIAGLEANKQSLELQGEKTVFDDNGVEVNIAQYRNNELAATINNINTYRNKKRELEASIIKINSQIDSAIVKASRSGSVNSYIELVEGDTLQGGVEVLSIIPENDSDYKVNIYVGNEDIGKLKNDMKVKFNVYAFPNSEYGYLTGTITSISNDLKVDQSSGSAYYLVEAILDKNKLYNSKGQKANLKAVMACQAQMITENKRILIYLLEKIDLWMDK